MYTSLSQSLVKLLVNVGSTISIVYVEINIQVSHFASRADKTTAAD